MHFPPGVRVPHGFGFRENLSGARSQVARKRQKPVDFRHCDAAPIAAVDRTCLVTIQSARRSIIIPAVIRIAHVHAAEPPAERREDVAPTVAAVGVVRIEPKTAVEERTVEKGAVKCDPAVNADYAVANCKAGMRSDPATAERAPGVKSASSADVKSATAMTASTAKPAMSSAPAAGGESFG